MTRTCELIVTRKGTLVLLFKADGEIFYVRTVMSDPQLMWEAQVSWTKDGVIPITRAHWEKTL